jgi:hypothetical protein
MDYEGAVEVINQLEAGSSEEDEFTIDALKAINNEIKLKEFTRQQNDAEAEKLIKSLSNPSAYQQQTARLETSTAQPTIRSQPQIQASVQSKPLEQPIAFQVKPKTAVQSTASKELSAATEELKNVMGAASKIELPKIKFNVKPKEVKIPPSQEVKPVPNMPKQQPSPAAQVRAPIQQKPQAVKKGQNVQQKQVSATQVPQMSAKTFKSILVGLPLHDQIEELTKISAGIDKRAFDKAHMNIIINEINALYEYSMAEQKTTNVFEQRLREMRAQRLAEVMEKLGKKGVAG